MKLTPCNIVYTVFDIASVQYLAYNNVFTTVMIHDNTKLFHPFSRPVCLCGLGLAYSALLSHDLCLVAQENQLTSFGSTAYGSVCRGTRGGHSESMFMSHVS